MTKKKETAVIVAAEITETIEIVQFSETIEKSGIEKTKAEKYAAGYAPLMSEVLQQAELLKPLDKTNPEDATKAKRISLDLGKICSRLATKKKEDKEMLLIETRLIDGLFNVAESTARLTQKEADEIVDYLAGLELERLAKLAGERKAELESYGADTSYLPLDIMGDEQYARCLESAKYAHEARLQSELKKEQERIAAEQAAIEAEKERQRLEAERIEAERLEAERVKAELAAREAELAEERRIAAEKEKARLEAEEQARRDREVMNRRFEQMILKEISALGFEQVADGIENSELGWFIGKRNYDGFDTETEAIEWFKETKERHRIMQEQAQATRAAEEKAEKLRHENEAKLAEQKRLADIEAKKQADIAAEQKRKADAELAKQRAEAEKLATELKAKKDAEAKAEADRKAAALAPDKDKINQLYKSLKTLEIPDFTSVECQLIGTEVVNKISHILSYIKDEAKKLN